MGQELERIIDIYPELYHYTNFYALKRIFETNKIRMTENNKLWSIGVDKTNPSEITIAAGYLEGSLSRRLLRFAQLAWASDLPPKVREFLEICKDPDEFAYVHGGALIDALRETIAQELPVYTASFCAHGSQSLDNQLNGQNRQWRAHQKDGGYCIVFDTKNLAELLKQEAVVHHWNFITFEPIVYAESDQIVDKHFEEVLTAAERMVSNMTYKGRHDNGFTIEHIAKSIRNLSLIKHPAFKDEDEVRVIGMPAVAEKVKRSEHLDPSKSFKKITDRKHAGQYNRYLTLFDAFTALLPIKRIIVGPSEQQTLRYRSVVELVGDKVDVRRSATPIAELGPIN